MITVPLCRITTVPMIFKSFTGKSIHLKIWLNFDFDTYQLVETNTHRIIIGLMIKGKKQKVVELIDDF